MRPLTITIHVNAAAAARSRRGHAGPSQLVLGADDLRTLSEAQRETLAKHYERTAPVWGSGHGPQWSDPLAWHAEPVDIASLQVLRQLLDRRAEVMAAYGARFHPRTAGRVEDVLLALAKDLPRRDVAGFAWTIVESALRQAAEQCSAAGLRKAECP